MAVPEFQAFMRPVLQILADGAKWTPKDLVTPAGDALSLSTEDRLALLPSGKATVLRSRVGWALAYMKQACLVETRARGVYQLTERGRQLLTTSNHGVTIEMLQEYPEFRAFQERSQGDAGNESVEPAAARTVSKVSPEEALESAYGTLRAGLVSELIDVLKRVSPARFESIVVDVLQAMGYGGGRAGAARAVGRSGDGGIDGVIEEDRLGLDTVYVQAKRWEGNVGRPVVQAFAGALQGQRAHKGVMITTSDYSPDARAYVNNLATRIVLIDGRRLAEMMIDHNVGVSAEVTYTVKRIDSDYFEE